MRLRLELVMAACLASSATAARSQGHAGHPEGSGVGEAEWRMPPMMAQMPMLPGLEGRVPAVDAFLPGAGIDPASLPEAKYREVVPLEDGDTLVLTAMFVRRILKDDTLTMYGFNGQYPGPIIRVAEEATIVVDFRNEIDLPSTIHWHGVRLENRFDGVPGITQDPVEPGGRFLYRVHLRDPGVYWYHPHIREDVQQDLGLYGNLLVDPPDEGYYAPVNREEVLMLDDLLIDENGLIPFGADAPTHVLMGRFGNVLLVNGEEGYELSVRRGEVVRFYLTNASNTRTFNLVFGGARLKVVAADVSRFEREEWARSVVIGPAQRYIVEALFDEPGDFVLTNAIKAIDHYRGEFFPHVDTLGVISVSGEPVAEDHRAAFERLRENHDLIAELAPYRGFLDRPPDVELALTLAVDGLPSSIVQALVVDTLFAPPLEFNDAMPHMNWLSTGREVRWVLREPSTGRENMEIEWTFEVGDAVKVRLFNDPRSLHPMHHPIHVHGQRFLILAMDGVPNANLAWKDTAIVPVGSTVDLLIEVSNPGDWMLHCHISEHLGAGMQMVFHVDGEGG